MQQDYGNRERGGYQQQHSYEQKQYSRGRPEGPNEDNFVEMIQRRFNIDIHAFKGIYDKVSKNKEDVLDFLESNGERQELLWTTDEDDMLKKHYQTPGHSLMKLLTKLKTRERIERRKQYLFLK